MSSPSPDSPESTLRATAARWAVRRDRGLSAAESIDYELWLAADPRHAAAMQRTSAAWSLLDRRLPLHRATPPSALWLTVLFCLQRRLAELSRG